MRIGEAQKVQAESQLKSTLDGCREMIAHVRTIDGQAASALDEKAEDLAHHIDRLKLLADDEEWERLRFTAEGRLGDLEKSCRRAKG